MKPSIPFLLLALSVVMLPQPSQGQRIAPSSAYALFRPAPTPPPARPASFIHRAPDYRWEGLAIGAIVGGTLGVLVVNAGCDTDGGCFTDAIGGMLLGGTAGGLFGLFAGLVTAKNTPPRPTETRTP